MIANFMELKSYQGEEFIYFFCLVPQERAGNIGAKL